MFGFQDSSHWPQLALLGHAHPLMEETLVECIPQVGPIPQVESGHVARLLVMLLKQLKLRQDILVETLEVWVETTRELEATLEEEDAILIMTVLETSSAAHSMVSSNASSQFTKHQLDFNQLPLRKSLKH